jgi:hypothetical protein
LHIFGKEIGVGVILEILSNKIWKQSPEQHHVVTEQKFSYCLLTSIGRMFCDYPSTEALYFFLIESNFLYGLDIELNVSWNVMHSLLHLGLWHICSLPATRNCQRKLREVANKPMIRWMVVAAKTLLRTKDCCTYSLIHAQQDALTQYKDIIYNCSLPLPVCGVTLNNVGNSFTSLLKLLASLRMTISTFHHCLEVGRSHFHPHPLHFSF